MKRKLDTQKPPVTMFRMMGDEKSRKENSCTRWELLADEKVVATIDFLWNIEVYNIQAGSKTYTMSDKILDFAAVAAKAKSLAGVV